MSPGVYRLFVRVIAGVHGGLYRLTGGRVGANLMAATQ
jgi:hypothetical protein